MSASDPKPAGPPAEGAIVLAEYVSKRGALRAWRMPAARGGGVALCEDGRDPVPIGPDDELRVEVESVPLDWSSVRVLLNGELLATFDVDETFDQAQPREVAEGLQAVVDVAYAALRPAS